MTAGTPLLFIHGAWVTPLSWERFIPIFEEQGYECLAPPWPFRDKPIDELRASPPRELAGLGVAEIVEHYAGIISAMDEPPILIGHSFGGLFVQMLLDRHLGRAGVAIDSAPPAGVLAYQPSAYRSLGKVLLTPLGWRRILHFSFSQFQYAFVNNMKLADQRAAYDRYVVPETGRIFFQAALAMADPHHTTRVDFTNPVRAPLLMIAGGDDHIVPAGVNRSNFRKYKKTRAVTDFKQFSGRSHWIIAQEGCEEVARYILTWLKK